MHRWTEKEVKDLLSRHSTMTSAAKEVGLSRERIRQLSMKFGIDKFTNENRKAKLLREDLWLLEEASLCDISKITGLRLGRLKYSYPGYRENSSHYGLGRSARLRVVLALIRDGETQWSVAKFFGWKSTGAITRLLAKTGKNVRERKGNWKSERVELIRKIKQKVVRNLFFAEKAIYDIVYSQKDKKLRYNL